MRVDWKRNLYIAWLGCFFTGASISLVMPFIPVFIETIGVPQSEVGFYAGLAISVTAFSAAIFAPIWGSLADRKGRKVMMIRASAGMTLTMGALAFVPNVEWLLIMRFLNGVLAGYIPNATAMIASQVPREKNGWALGTLATGAVAGNLIGPMMGGFLAEAFGMRNVFLITSGILMVTTLLTVLYVKEDFVPMAKKDILPTKEILAQVKQPSLLYGMFITTLILQIGVTSISPILTLYVRQLGGDMSNILFVSGMIVSVAGVSAFMSSPILGKLGDRVGNHNVLFVGLIGFFLCILPMAFVTTPTQLGVLRFLMGFSTGALMPSINSIISRITPKDGISRIFSFNQMSQNFGQVLGPLTGSIIATSYGYRGVFIGTSLFILANVGLSFYNFRGILFKKKLF